MGLKSATFQLGDLLLLSLSVFSFIKTSRGSSEDKGRCLVVCVEEVAYGLSFEGWLWGAHLKAEVKVGTVSQEAKRRDQRPKGDGVEQAEGMMCSQIWLGTGP